MKMAKYKSYGVKPSRECSSLHAGIDRYTEHTERGDTCDTYERPSLEYKHGVFKKELCMQLKGWIRLFSWLAKTIVLTTFCSAVNLPVL